MLGHTAFAESKWTAEELTKLVKKAYTARYQLIECSRGKARLKFVSSSTELEKQAMNSRINKQLGIERSKLVVDGEEEWTLSWAQNKERIRYDKEILQLPEERHPLSSPEKMRLACDGENSIYYSEQTNEGYINIPSTPAMNPRTLRSFFDIRHFYKFNHTEVFDLLTLINESNKLHPTLEEVKLDRSECVKYSYVWKTNVGKRTMEQQFALWFAPSQSLSLLKAEFITMGYDKAGLTSPTRQAEILSAQYTESTQYPGTWLTQEYDITLEQSGTKEKLHASFDYEDIGLTVPESEFTFKGLKVPHGTLIYDKRLPDVPPIRMRFNGTLLTVPDQP